MTEADRSYRSDQGPEIDPELGYAPGWSGVDTLKLVVPTCQQRRSLDLPTLFTVRAVDVETGEIVERTSARAELRGGWKLDLRRRQGTQVAELEGSAPRALLGHNIQPVAAGQLDEAVELVLDEAAALLDDELRRDRIGLRRVDAVRDFIVPRPRAFLERIGPNLRGPLNTYRSARGVVESQVVGSTSSGWRVTAYVKAAHLGSVAGLNPTELAIAEDRIRVEVGLRRRFLRARGVDHLDDLTPERVTELARQAVKAVRLDTPVGLGQVAERVEAAQGQGSQIERAIGMLVTEELTGTSTMSPMTRRRNRRLLEAYNLDAADILRPSDDLYGALDFEIGALNLEL